MYGSLKVFCEVRIYDVKPSLTRPSQADSFAKLSENYEALLESGKWSDFTGENVEVDVFELLIQYIYTGKVNQLRKYADQLLVAADKYHLNILKSICEKSLILHLNAESVCAVLLLADMHNADILKLECIEYMVEHAKEVMQTDGWKDLAISKRSDLIAKLFEKLANKYE